MLVFLEFCFNLIYRAIIFLGVHSFKYKIFEKYSKFYNVQFSKGQVSVLNHAVILIL
jgi:hypothetical protein